MSLRSIVVLAGWVASVLAGTPGGVTGSECQGAVADEAVGPGALAAGPVSVEASGLHHVFRLTPGLYSGGSPEGDADFAALARLGVRTLVSVDGAAPDVELARKHGLRYVHLPHGYDGIGTNTQLRLVQAARALPGPLYVHCHHGKHRGPAAAATICLGNAGWTVDQAEAFLRQAGTSPQYGGLYESLRRFRSPLPAELDALPATFPERAPVPGLVEAMVAVDEHWGHLQAIRAAGYRTPKDHPDLQPANEALMLREQYREAVRLPESGRRGAAFLDRFVRSEHEVGILEALLRGLADASGPTAEARLRLDAAFDRVGQSCGACHRDHRDVAAR